MPVEDFQVKTFANVDFNDDEVPASWGSFDAGDGAADHKAGGLVHDMGWGGRVC